MLLYTHIITALRVRDILGLQMNSPDAYLLGAILPDIRYQSDIPRDQTHLPLEEFIALARRCPALERDLLTGYLVHLIADEFLQEDLSDMMFPRTPGKIRKHIQLGLLSVMLEIGYRTQDCGARLFQREAGCLGHHLGLPELQVHEMVNRVEAYLHNPTLAQAMEILKDSDLRSNRNIQFYLRVGRTIHQISFLQRIIAAKVTRKMGVMEQALALRCRTWLEKDPFNWILL